MGMDRAPRTRSPDRNGRPAEPSRRALDAMASAARRARRDEDRPLVDDGNEETGNRRLVARATASGRMRAAGGGTGIRPPVPPSQADWRPGLVRSPASRAWGADRHTRRGVAARRTRVLLVTGTLGILVVAGTGIALDLALRSPARPATSTVGASHRPPASRRGTGTRTATSGGARPRPSGKHAQGTQGAGGAASSTTAPSTTVAPAPTGAPRLASVSPVGGSAGRTVVVDGSGLFSSNGEVVAYFGSTQAPTSCPSRTSCTVTVPDLGAGPSTVRLTVVTSQGRSNALGFSYG